MRHPLTVQTKRQSLVCEDDRLQPRNVEALAAAQIFAAHDVVFPQHIGAGFGELCTISIVSATGQLALFGAHQPGHIVFGRLMAMRAVKCGGLLLRFFVEKVSLVHGGRWLLD